MNTSSHTVEHHTPRMLVILSEPEHVALERHHLVEIIYMKRRMLSPVIFDRATPPFRAMLPIYRAQQGEINKRKQLDNRKIII
jgi:hypothetical protein